MLQFFINISLGLGLGFLWIRIMRPPKDDPRMSRGLQLLQSKISILEDLSDRTDNQVKQLTLLLEEKAKHVQRSIEAAQDQIYQLEVSMKKSHEVARIFQDKIPHEEIISRQNTVKYVKAAQMSHQGHSLEEIQKVVDIPLSELEFIAKVNREKLMFAPESLPPWVKYELDTQTIEESPVVEKAYREAFEPAPQPSLNAIGEEFRKAVSQMKIEEPEAIADLFANPTEPLIAPQTKAEFQDTVTQPKADTKKIISESTAGLVRPYNFPRIDLKSKAKG